MSGESNPEIIVFFENRLTALSEARVGILTRSLRIEDNAIPCRGKICGSNGGAGEHRLPHQTFGIPEQGTKVAAAVKM